MRTEHDKAIKVLLDVDRALYAKNPKKVMKEKENQMAEAVKELDFETAAILRDEIRVLQIPAKARSTNNSNKKK